MKRAYRLSLLLLVGLILLAPAARAQDATVLQLHPDSKLWMEGTSNMNDWKVDATEMNGAIRLAPGGPVAAPCVETIRLQVAAAHILSHKSIIMDRLMHKALKAEAHPEIVYELVRAETAPGDGPNRFVLQTTGRLTLGGVTREIDLALQGERLADGALRFTGRHELLMTDYGLQPPTAMFGALRTGDRVVVHFDVIAAPGAGTR